MIIVNQQHPAAADTNAGSVEQPLKTISAAVAMMQPGDTVRIYSGIYRETVTITTSGSADAPITIQAADDAYVVINGADIVSGWERVPGEQPLWTKAPWPAWAGYDMRMESIDAKPQLIVDSVLLTHVEDRARLLPGSFCYEPSDAGGAIYLWPFPPRDQVQTLAGAQWWESPVNLASDDPNAHQVEVGVRCLGINMPQPIAYLTLRGLHVRYGSGGYPAGNALQIGTEEARVSHVTLEDCSAEDHNGGALCWRGEDLVMRRCYFRHCGVSSGAIVFNSLMEDCVFDGHSNRGISHGWSAGAIKFLHTKNTTVRRCQFINNDGPGLWFDWGNADNVIEQCLMVNNYGPGLMIEVSPHFASAEVAERAYYENIFRDGNPTEPAGYTIIRNNICAYNRWDATLGCGILLQMASNCVVVHNTVVGNEKFGIFGRYHPYDTVSHRVVDNIVINNICQDNGGSQIYFTQDPADKPGFVSRNRIDHNILFSTTAWNRSEHLSELRRSAWKDKANFARWGKSQDNGTYSVEEWCKISGYDEHSLQWNPELVSPATLDFRLNPASPAIGAGEVTEFVTDDFLGRPRPVDRAPSIGALEFFAGKPELPDMPMR
jgi:hypothetical protein